MEINDDHPSVIQAKAWAESIGWEVHLSGEAIVLSGAGTHSWPRTEAGLHGLLIDLQGRVEDHHRA